MHVCVLFYIYTFFKKRGNKGNESPRFNYIVHPAYYQNLYFFSNMLVQKVFTVFPSKSFGLYSELKIWLIASLFG